MVPNGPVRPPKTYALITLTLMGLVSLDAYETRRDSRKLSMRAPEPLPKKAEAFCHSRAVSEKRRAPWLWRPIFKSEQ
jgi:hypothetical protein